MGRTTPSGGPPPSAAIRDMRLNHFNLAGQVDNVRDLVAWHNRVQELAPATGPGIPVTLSTDPRHSFSNNPGTGRSRGRVLRMAASRSASPPSATPTWCERYADIARQEYLAAGIRVALHPQIDLATEPRWARDRHDLRRGRRPDLAARSPPTSAASRARRSARTRSPP